MIAKVLHNNSVYYSPVFAVSIKRNDCKAVVFDSTFSELVVLTIFRDTFYNILFIIVILRLKKKDSNHIGTIETFSKQSSIKNILLKCYKKHEGYYRKLEFKSIQQ